MCIAHVRKYVAKRADSILNQAEGDYDEGDEKLRKLEVDFLKELKELLKEPSEEGGGQLGWLHQE